MLKISESLKDVLTSNPYLDYGLYHGLFTVSKVAEMIKPFVEIRTKKSISVKALEMALLRFKESENKNRKRKSHPAFKLEKISITNGLRIETFEKNVNTHKILQKYYEYIAKHEGFCSITESLAEISLVYEEKYKTELKKINGILPKVSLEKAAALYAQFSVEYLAFPGMLHHILHVLLTQGINILELASTSTSIVIYLQEKDLKLAFNTLHDRLFVK